MNQNSEKVKTRTRQKFLLINLELIEQSKVELTGAESDLRKNNDRDRCRQKK